MNKKIIYICDYMVEHVAGGAELNDSELIKILIENNHKVTKI